MTQTIAQHGLLDNMAERYAKARAVMGEESLCIKHYRPTVVSPYNMLRSERGGMTVVFRHRQGNSFIEISTAVCSIRDMYHRKVGTVLAVENFFNGQTIRIPTYGAKPTAVLESLFGDYFTVVLDDDEDEGTFVDVGLSRTFSVSSGRDEAGQGCRGCGGCVGKRG